MLFISFLNSSPARCLSSSVMIDSVIISFWYSKSFFLNSISANNFWEGPQKSSSIFWDYVFIFLSGFLSIRTQTAANTALIVGTGADIFFKIAICPPSIACNASSAFLSSGNAASKSFWQSSLMSFTLSAIFWASFSSISTFALITSASCFSLVTTMIFSSVILDVSISWGCKFFSCSYIMVTFYSVLIKQSYPFSYQFLSPSISFLFSSNNVLNALMSSR